MQFTPAELEAVSNQCLGNLVKTLLYDELPDGSAASNLLAEVISRLRSGAVPAPEGRS